jgi:DNA-binding phage protein
MSASNSQPAGRFWEDLQENLRDEQFRRHYVASALQIATVDALVNALDDQRQALGLSKTELARAVGRSPESIRRLLTVEDPNPTLTTFVELAAAVGLSVALVPAADAKESASVPGGRLPGCIAPS